MEPNALSLSEPVNLRDLGGIPVQGGVIAAGFAIRSDDLSTIPPETAARLVEGGLTSVVDLRSREEVLATGRGTLFHHMVSYHHVPFMNSLADSGMKDATPTAQLSMADFYPSLFESAAAQIVSALGIIANSAGTVAFHCAAGRDRTGVLAAALLLALGANDEEVIADYERTRPNEPAIMKRMEPNLRQVMKAAGIELDKVAATMTVQNDDAMRVTLRTLRDRHTDPLAPLKDAGLNHNLISQLRDRAGVS